MTKKILIILIITTAIIFIQKLDFDWVAKNELGQVEGVSQQENTLKVVVFDVGQGDSIFIQTPGEKQILIDGGESQIILEKLNQEMKFNDRQIDIVVLTHPHADHLGGLIEVLKRYQVSAIWMTGVIHTSNVYLEFLNLIKEKNIPTKIIFSCQQDELEGCSDLIEIETGVQFKILYPLENLFEKRIDNLNNSSIVMRLDYDNSSLLLMGDAETPVEKEILENFKIEELKADVLKVGHQGASDASSQEFLEIINPEYAIISVGADNSYGHPSLRIIRRIERLGIKILRTDEMGDIQFVANENSLILLNN